MPLDQVRVERVLSRLPEEDATWLAGVLDFRSPAQRRLDERDAAIRAAWSHFPGPRTVAARQFAHRLAWYLATAAWRAEQDLPELPDDADGIRRALHRVARAGEGKPLSWRQLLNVRDGHRG